jgi:hypothetical protein
MTLSFFTHNQQMTFVDPNTHTVVNAWSLMPNAVYDVFFVVQNDSTVMATNVQIKVTHSAVGIGLPGGASQIIQPALFDVPPAGPGGNGLQTVEFQYITPPGGHCCLYATIQPNGPTLYQNTDVVSVPKGAVSNLSFLVFNPHNVPEVMKLELTETPASPTWGPKLIAPVGVGPTTPTVAPINITLAPNSFYSIILQLTVPLNATGAHTFHIVGKVGNAEVGAVDKRVELGPIPMGKPSPYVIGGYQSSDVILKDHITGVDIPLGGQPGGAWDTLLQPNTDYIFAAWVHNASGTPATNTVVRFWEFLGGTGLNGNLIDIQTVTVPAWSSTLVYSAHPFHSAPAGHHKCAVVSIFNALAGTCPDASTFGQIPNPMANFAHSCSAWRNTDSMWVLAGGNWNIYLELAQPIFDGGPVEINVNTQHVPLDWATQADVLDIEKTLAAGAAVRQTPPFLAPAMQGTLKPVDLKIAVKPNEGVKADPIQRGKLETIAPALHIHPIKEKPTGFTVSGTVPATAKPGEIFLVKVTAHYPKTAESPERAVEFLEALYVKEK